MGNLRRVVRSVERGTARLAEETRARRLFGIARPKRRRKPTRTLPPLATNPAERRESRCYRPAPWSDVELGQVLDTGHSPAREARLKRKAAHE